MPLDKVNMYERLTACMSLLYLSDRYLISNQLYNDLNDRYWPTTGEIKLPNVMNVQTETSTKASGFSLFGKKSSVNHKLGHSSINQDVMNEFVDERDFYFRSQKEEGEKASRAVETLLKRNQDIPLSEEEYNLAAIVFLTTTQKHQELVFKADTMDKMIEHLVTSHMTKEEIDNYLHYRRDFEAVTDIIVNRRKLMAMEIDYREAEYRHTYTERKLRELGAIELNVNQSSISFFKVLFLEMLPMVKDYHEIHRKYGLRKDFRFPMGRQDLNNMRRGLEEGELMTSDEQALVKKDLSGIGMRFDDYIRKPGVTVDDVEVEKIRCKEEGMIAYSKAKIKRLYKNNEASYQEDIASWHDLERHIYQDWMNVNARKVSEDQVQQYIWSIEMERERRKKKEKREGTIGGKWLQRWLLKLYYPILLAGFSMGLVFVYETLWEWYDWTLVDEDSMFDALFETVVSEVLEMPDLMKHFDNINPIIEESTMTYTFIHNSAPAGTEGMLITVPLIGYNNKKAIITIQAYKKAYKRRWMYRVYPATIDLMNGRLLTWHPAKDIFDVLGLMNEFTERIIDAGESPPYFGMYRLFGGDSVETPDEIAQELRKRRMIPEKWE